MAAATTSASEPSGGAAAGEAPCGSLVVHQATGPVDGVDDDRPSRSTPDDYRFIEALRNECDFGPVLLEPCHQGVVRERSMA